MNTARLSRKNETALTILVVLTIFRLIVTGITASYLYSKAWMVVQFVLGIILVGGCIALYKWMSDSELAKFISCGGFILVATISIFNSHAVYNALPFCVLIVATLIYLDESFSVLCAVAAAVVMLIKAVVLFVGKDVASGGEWIIVEILFLIMSFCLYKTASFVVRAQETDEQEIKYHLMYQEELTQNMVNVVENGNQHIESLQAKLNEFSDATEEVVRSVDAISHGVTETVLGIENQTDMTAQIQNIIDDLIQVKDYTLSSAEQAVGVTEEGGRIVGQLKEKSDAIAVANQSVTEVARELQEKISSAEEITQIIYQVSSQTNLLALNASIEAARAGEAGRGFSVVADEIRKLADNTKQSIDKITDLLQGVTKLAEQTSKLVVNSVQASEAQAEYIDKVTSAFSSIAGVVDELHNNMTSLDDLSNNLNKSNNAIIDSLMNQQAASQEMAANAQSSADLSQSNMEELVQVVGELNQIAEIIGSLSQVEGMQDTSAPKPVYEEEKQAVPEESMEQSLLEEEASVMDEDSSQDEWSEEAEEETEWPEQEDEASEEVYEEDDDWGEKL